MVASVFVALSELVLGWLSLFAAPFADLNLLWVVIPVYIGWLFNEFYQEKIGTSFGNAITNGAVLIWIAVDWARTATGFLGTDVLGLTLFKFVLCMIAVSAGIFIIVEGIHRKRIVKFIGRSRNVTYFLLVFTPILYNVIDLSLGALLVIILFFPIYYLLVEIIDRIVPDPKIYKDDAPETIPNEKERRTLEKQMSEKTNEFGEFKAEST